jgi:hypothetical protein
MPAHLPFDRRRRQLAAGGALASAAALRPGYAVAQASGAARLRGGPGDGQAVTAAERRQMLPTAP